MNWFHRQVCRSGRWRRRVKNLLPWALQGVELGEDVLEIVPGPGVTTDLLRGRTRRLTALEVDAAAAASLQTRLDALASALFTATGRQCRSRTAPFPASSRSRRCTMSHRRRDKTGCWRRLGGCCGPVASSSASMALAPFSSGSSIWATRTRQSIRTRSGRDWRRRVSRKSPSSGGGARFRFRAAESSLRFHPAFVLTPKCG